MTETSTGRAPRSVRAHLLEALTIVFGILAALLLDAGWGWLADRAEEREILVALRTELVQASEELASDQEARGLILARTAALSDAVETGQPPPAEGLTAQLVALTDYRFFTPPRAVLDDLVSSGRMELIRSDAIRLALLAYSQEAERLSVVEREEMSFLARRMEPFLSERVPLPRPLSYEAGPAGPETRAAVVSLLADPLFRNLLIVRWSHADVSHRFATGLGRWLERALAAIDRELA